MLLALSWILVVPTISPVLNLEFETRSAGEPGAYDSHVQWYAGHRGEWAVARAGDWGHRGRLRRRSCCQQVTLQLNNPLVNEYALVNYYIQLIHVFKRN
jgi:hypothetical protein